MPFNLRHFEEETKARMGVVECVAHKMIEPFQVLYEKPGKWNATNTSMVKLNMRGKLRPVEAYAVRPDTLLDYTR